MRYTIFKHNITIKNVAINSFGIRVYAKNTLICELFDVSTDYKALKNLVDSLNENEIDVIHLDSILEDFYLDNV